MINKTTRWNTILPEAMVGLLIMTNLDNPKIHAKLQEEAQLLEFELRERYKDWDRPQIRDIPVYAAYDAFYRRFRKSYHVQLQLESVIIHGKSIQAPSALVACMFMAELKTGLLTAAHDFTTLQTPLTAEIASGDETYTRLNGEIQRLKEGDLFIKDQVGILSSVIYGPDQRTQVKSDTTQAAYTTYAPPGIDEDRVRTQLELLEEYVRLVAPDSEKQLLVVI
jgi:DNA/RNA-binding domain of Phe-tRNA-synthetase-like protein